MLYICNDVNHNVKDVKQRNQLREGANSARGSEREWESKRVPLWEPHNRGIHT